MAKMSFQLLCALTFWVIIQEQKSAAVDLNLTKFLALRQKRNLIYENGGSVKFSISGVWPVYLEDDTNWRQLNCIVSVQSQYKLPENVLTPWDKWELPEGKSLKDARQQFDRTGHYKPDPSRMFVYAALEDYMNRNGRNGRQCLLRAICENAQINGHGDVYSRIIDVVLTPGKDDLDEVYRNAMEAGKFGADCLSVYSGCPYGDSVLDRVAAMT